jgi:hypothetical protein
MPRISFATTRAGLFNVAFQSLAEIAMAGPSRLRNVALEDYPEPQKSVLAKVSAARGRIPGPLKVWLQSGRLAQAIEPLSTMLNTQSTLAKREWEIAVIVIARHWKSSSVLNAHYSFMRASGAAEPVIAALKASVPTASPNLSRSSAITAALPSP